MQPVLQSVVFPSASERISLEGRIVCDPQGRPAPGLVVCHAHPLYGGSLDNNVVSALLQALSRAGYVTLAFNFRGVGRSQGRYEDGEGEVRDVEGAIRFLADLPQTRGCALGVWGYSFGAWVGLRAALREERVRCLGAVAPPWNLYAFDFLENSDLPVCVVSGDQDPFCPVSQGEIVLSKYKGAVEWKVISGADHFLWGHESEVARFAREASGKHLPLGGP